MEILFRDIRYGIRMLTKRPGFTAVAIIALALGIGANTAVFSVINAVLLRPLPFANPDRLVNVWTTRPQRGINKMVSSYPDFSDWRSRNNVFEGLAAYTEADYTLTGGDSPLRVGGMATSSDLFSVLGANPIIGRTFSADDDRNGAPLTVVFSHRLWKQNYNFDPGVIGSTVTLNSKSYTVIGVMPEGFQFPVQSKPVELWTTFANALTASGEDSIAEQRGAHFLRVIGRLKRGVTPQQARADVETIAGQLTDKYPDTNTGIGVTVNPASEDLVGDVRPALLIMMGAVGCVLLIACTNVASLLLARATTRHKEMAIRAALGASRVRVLRQLLTESLVLSIAGGAIGLLIALWGTDALVAVSGDELPRAAGIGLDMRVLGFTLLVSLVTGVLFGIAPAIHASKTDLNEALKEGGRGGNEGARRNRLRSALVTAEVAIAVVLLTGAGLLLQSLWRMQKVDTGINTHNVISLELGLPDVRYTASQQREFYRQLQTRLSNLPGVVSASAVYPLPLTNVGMSLSFEIEGRPLPRGDHPSASYRAVSLDFFRTVGMRIIKGRDFTERDDNPGPDVIAINQALADRNFPGEDPIGKRIRPSIQFESGKEPVWREIIAIVNNVKYRGPLKDAGPEYYVPESQIPFDSMVLTVKTAGDPRAIVGAVRDEVRAMDKDLPLYNIRTLDDYLSTAVAQPRLFAVLLAIFAGLALALTAIGLYGVMSYSVAQRTHEMGIRMALGARPANVLQLVVRQGMTVAGLGVGIGLLAALVTTRVMATLLFGIGARDPLTFSVIAIIIAGVALAACFAPARRATKVDPMVALRYE